MNIYNWLREFFTGRSHATFLKAYHPLPYLHHSQCSTGFLLLGPAMFVLNGVDMPAYADDTYLLVPSDNEHTTNDELNSIIAWASTKNISLNSAKSMEIIFHKPRSKCQVPLISVLGSQIPRVSPNKNSRSHLISGTLSITPHVNLIVAVCRSRFSTQCAQATWDRHHSAKHEFSTLLRSQDWTLCCSVFEVRVP